MLVFVVNFCGVSMMLFGKQNAMLSVPGKKKTKTQKGNKLLILEKRGKDTK